MDFAQGLDVGYLSANLEAIKSTLDCILAHKQLYQLVKDSQLLILRQLLIACLCDDTTGEVVCNSLSEFLKQQPWCI